MGLPKPVAELSFERRRKWRFDFAWPEHMLALEVEGGIWTGGRHTNPLGYLGDMAKYNHATVLGWRILRTMPKDLCTIKTFQLIRPLIVK